MIQFGIVGALGRMGQAIARLAAQGKAFHLVALIEYEKNPRIGETLGDVKITALKNTNPPTGGLIDFSHASSVIESAQYAAANNLPLVVGTTGFSNEQRAELEAYAQKIPLLIASNMSVGVNVLFALVEQAAEALKHNGFDPEVMEIHHNLKKDSPSGTAVSLQKILQKSYQLSDKEVLFGREGLIGERKPKELGVMALRGGDVIGDHTVYFLGQGERIEIKHQAVSRETFAQGALAALRYLQGKPRGLYSMKDVLGLN